MHVLVLKRREPEILRDETSGELLQVGNAHVLTAASGNKDGVAKPYRFDVRVYRK